MDLLWILPLIHFLGQSRISVQSLLLIRALLIVNEINMVGSCSAINCTTKRGTPHTSFHRFPHKKPELLRKWVHNVKRKDCAPNEHSLLCSKHFDESCFVVGKRIKLKCDAVPTKFVFGKSYYDKPLAKKKRPPPKRQHHSPSKIAKIITSDHSYSKTETSDVCNSSKVKELTHKVKALEEKVRHRNKKIKNMKDLLTSLKEKQLIEHEQYILLNHNFWGNG